MADAEAGILEYPMPRTDPLLPPPKYDELRAGPPVLVQMPTGKRAWLLTRHEDVRAAMADPRLSSDFMHPNFPSLNPLPPSPGAFSFVRMDAPEHGRLRRMAVAEFTPRKVREMRPIVQRIVDRLLDRMEAGPQPADLMEQFAGPFPSLVIAEILGVPSEDLDVFQDASRTIANASSSVEVATAAFTQLTGYLSELADKKLVEPTDDLLSRLAVDYEATGQLTRYELITMATLLLFAGHETSSNQIALSVLLLMRDPEALDAVRRDPGLLEKAAVEELLRHASPKQHDLIRVATEDVEIGGVKIAKGDGVITSQPAANHDERAFPDPHKLDFTRDARMHVTFGNGPHACLGASLAKLEVEVALATLLRRFPGLKLAAEIDEIPFRHAMLIYGVHALPVTW